MCDDQLTLNLLNLYHTGYLSDVKINFIDTSSKRQLFTVSTHKFILYASGVKSLTKLLDTNFSDLRKDSTIQIELDLDLYTEKILRLFVGLLYYPKIVHTSLTLETLEFINEHVLYFHQLALYFEYTNLLWFCNQLICEDLSEENIDNLYQYCMMYNTQTSQYYVPEEKLSLYKHLIQWSAYCLPNSNDPVYCVERPRKLLTHNTVDYYRRICTQCLQYRTKSFSKTHLIDMGFIGDETTKYLFYGMYERGDSDYVTLLVRQITDHHHYIQKLSSHIKLFSKTITMADMISKTVLHGIKLNHPISIGGIHLHDNSHCYVSTCDLCNKKKTSIFIIHVSLIFEQSQCDDNHKCDEYHKEEYSHNG